MREGDRVHLKVVPVGNDATGNWSTETEDTKLVLTLAANVDSLKVRVHHRLHLTARQQRPTNEHRVHHRWHEGTRVRLEIVSEATPKRRAGQHETRKGREEGRIYLMLRLPTVMTTGGRYSLNLMASRSTATKASSALASLLLEEAEREAAAAGVLAGDLVVPFLLHVAESSANSSS